MGNKNLKPTGISTNGLMAFAPPLLIDLLKDNLDEVGGEFYVDNGFSDHQKLIKTANPIDQDLRNKIEISVAYHCGPTKVIFKQL